MWRDYDLAIAIKIGNPMITVFCEYYQGKFYDANATPMSEENWIFALYQRGKPFEPAPTASEYAWW